MTYRPATVYVTNNGEVMAVLVPPPRAAGASLRIRRATVRGDSPKLERTEIQEPVQDILDKLRGDR